MKEKIKDATRKLRALHDDPQEGLFAWCDSLGKAIHELESALKEEPKKPRFNKGDLVLMRHTGTEWRLVVFGIYEASLTKKYFSNNGVGYQHCDYAPNYRYKHDGGECPIDGGAEVTGWYRPNIYHFGPLVKGRASDINWALTTHFLIHD